MCMYSFICVSGAYVHPPLAQVGWPGPASSVSGAARACMRTCRWYGVVLNGPKPASGPQAFMDSKYVSYLFQSKV